DRRGRGAQRRGDRGALQGSRAQRRAGRDTGTEADERRVRPRPQLAPATSVVNTGPGQAACRELGLVSSLASVSSSTRGEASGGGMPPKASVVAWSHFRTVSRVRSRRSRATTPANREGSPVTTEAPECSRARLARPAPPFPTGIGSAAPISFARR